VSLKRTTAEAELGEADAASGAAVAPALLGGGVTDASGTAGAGAFSELAAGVGGSLGAGNSLGAFGTAALGMGAGSACGAGAEAGAGATTKFGASVEAAAAADAGGVGAAECTGFAEATGGVAAEALTVGVCAQRRVGLISATSMPRQRKQSPQTRADVEELIEVLTLEPESFGHRDLNCKQNCRSALHGRELWPTSSARIDPRTRGQISGARVAYAPPMTTTQHPDRVVLHIAGSDRPGVTARLAQVIAEDQSAQLINIGQSVLHGYLMLSAIVDLPKDSHALRKLLFAATDMGLRFEATPFLPHSAQGGSEDVNALNIIVLGPLGDGVATAAITNFLAKRGMNIREIRSLSEHELDGLELTVDPIAGTLLGTSELSELRGQLLRLGMEHGVDLAVQRDDVFRRSKRLVCMDVDSTFVKGEFIDDLAELAGCKEQVAAITARAMRGELDFKQALAERVKLLEGLPYERARALIERFELTPGADRFVKILHKFGFLVGLVSGGFTFFVDELKARFGLDFAFANELEIVDGKLTGRVLGNIVDGARKAQVLKEMAQTYACPLEQTVAIGDGANDIFMLQTAGLGIAFRAKPKLQEVAHMSLNHHERLDTLLYLMGFNARDLRLA